MTAATNYLKAKVKSVWTIADVLSLHGRDSQVGANVTCLNPDRHKHGDEHPSAVVYADRLWCPVCNSGWDVIDLYGLAKHLDFKESLEAMARERGIPVPEKSNKKKSNQSKLGTIERTYDYKDENVVLLYQVVRFRDPKDFRQRRPDPAKRDGWNWSLKSVRRVLYRLPELLKADPEAWVFVVEGEKDADNLALIGLDATCNAMGAGKWLDSYSESLAGRRVAILSDNDEVGKEHGITVARSLHGVADDVRLVDLGLSEKGADVSDWLATGGSKIKLLELVESTPPFTAKGGPKPNIVLAPGQLLRVLKESESALLQDRVRDPVFDLNGRGTICRISKLRKRETFRSKSITRENRTLLISVLDDRQTVQRLMRAANFFKLNEEGEPLPCDCPERIGAHFAHQGRYDLLPTLTGIICAPTIRSDDSVLETPGYDEATGLVLDAMPDEFPAIPSFPSRRDALAALSLLQDLLSDFPYATPADASAGLSAILTALLRRSVDIAPAHSFDAPDMSSGKTTHAHLPSLIATGRLSSVLGWPETEEERRKSLFALLLAGDSVAVIDNVEKPLQSGVLCGLITTPELTGRILGVSRNATVSTATCWMITGNNLTLVGDLTSRVVPCRLDPKVEFAEEREFKRDINTYVLQNRGEIVRAALTIVQAYLRSGDSVKISACRFPAWSRLVREPLVWIGLADPMEGTKRLRRDDAGRERLSGLMTAWHSAFQDSPVSLRDVIARSERDADLKAALTEVAVSDRTKNLDSRTLGYFLRSRKGKVVDGKTFLPAESEKHRGVTLWELVDPFSRMATGMSSITSMSSGSSSDDGGDGGHGGDPCSQSGSVVKKFQAVPEFHCSITESDPELEPDSGLAAGYIENPDERDLWSDSSSEVDGER